MTSTSINNDDKLENNLKTGFDLIEDENSNKNPDSNENTQNEDNENEIEKNNQQFISNSNYVNDENENNEKNSNNDENLKKPDKEDHLSIAKKYNLEVENLNKYFNEIDNDQENESNYSNEDDENNDNYDEDLPIIIEYYNKWKKNEAENNNNFEDDEYLNKSKKTNSNNNTFSKSFESSLNDLDDIITRVDNGIKLKRKKDEKNETESIGQELKPSNSNNDSNRIDVESLKKEWSVMFSKLEEEYKIKLEEQQKLNDEKLKSLGEDIKKSIFEQQEKLILKQQENNHQQPSLKSSIDLNEQNTISLAPTNNVNSASQIVDNAKYISNLRLELKTKHDRHVQDLKNYYEKEIEDLNKKLNYFKTKCDENELLMSKSSFSIENFEDLESSAKLYESLTRTNEEYLKLNSDLNEANKKLLEKLSQANQHVNKLKHENLEIKKKLEDNEQKTKSTTTKIGNLEMCISQLELQLTDSIKSQDEFIGELHNEKRNLIKKMQECEDLKLTIKYLEQKCTNLETKLNQKESMITSLKQKYIQLEQETNRIEYEYQKFRNNQTTLTFANNSIKSSSFANKENNEVVSYKKNLKINSSSSSRSNSANSENYSLAQVKNNHQFQPNDDYLTKQHKPRIDTHLECLINNARQSLPEYRDHFTKNHDDSDDIESFEKQNQQRHYQEKTDLMSLDPDKQLKYIEKLENDFDLLMKHKQQLDSQLTRLPQKITNASMHVYKENIENELGFVEKKLASTKLELRKLNIIKPH